MASVLVIDDDDLLCRTVSKMLARSGHDTVTAVTMDEGLRKALSGAFDVVLLDVRMPDGSGLDLLPRIQQAASSPEVIIITGFGDPDGAELAIRSGAWDYIQKPFSMDAVTLYIDRAIQYRHERNTAKADVHLKRERIIGESPKMISCLEVAAQAAAGDGNVLITGETGTGKELLAWAIHENSSHSYGNFVAIDCAALPKTLVEAILFGHEKGAFTGADKAREGMIKQAHRGTLFLDEVAELPHSIQKAFLRVLQEKKFRPLGGDREIGSDFRLVAATNQDLELMVQNGSFRKDLLFRLRAFTIPLPPLREREDDIRQLADHFLNDICRRYGMSPKKAAPELLASLSAYDWPGNVRELMNVMETSVAAARHESTLFPKHLPIHVRVHAARSSVKKVARGTEIAQSLNPEGPTGGNIPNRLPPFREFRKDTLDEAERRYLDQLMAGTGSMADACLMSGLSRSRLYDLLKKHNLTQEKESENIGHIIR